MTDTYQVSIVKVGTRLGRKSEVYLNWPIYGRPDEPIGMDYFVWVARNDERTVVIDTGFSRSGGENRDRTFVLEPGEAFTQLGITPESAPTVLITHAHYDHIGNLDWFPNSPMVIARREFEFWMSTMAQRTQFHHSVEDAELAQLGRIHGEGRLTTFDGEHDVAPGIRMVEVGGHTPGQSIVLVDTADGCVALVSDAVHYMEEFEGDLPFAFVADLPAMYRGFDSIRAMAQSGDIQHVVPGHDPDTLDRFTPVAQGPLKDIAATIG